MRSAAPTTVSSPKTQWFKGSRLVLVASAAVSACLIGVRQLGVLQSLELAAYDQMVRWQPDRGPDSRLLVVGITDDDIQRLNQFPLHDQTVARLLKQLRQYQPQAIGLDIWRDVPVGEGQAELVQELRDNQQVVAVCKVNSATSAGAKPPQGIPQERVAAADMIIDQGGTIRRALLSVRPPEPSPTAVRHFCNDPNQERNTLSLSLTFMYLGARGISPRLTERGDLQLGSVVLKPLEPGDGSYYRADTAGYQILLNYRSARQSVQKVSLAELLSGQVDPALVKGRVVLVGYTGSTAKDDFYTPYSVGQQDGQKMDGVVVHAQVVSQLLSAVLDQRPLFWFWAEWQEGLWIGVWALAGGLLSWRIRRFIWFSLTAIGSLGLLVGLGFGLFLLGGWVPLVPPALAAGMTAAALMLTERFQRSGYADKLAEGVKRVLRIDIDEAKKAEQVAEIKETDYFKSLRQQAKLLRQQHEEAPPPIAATPPDPPQAEPTPNADTDYLKQSLQRVKRLKHRNPDTDAE